MNKQALVIGINNYPGTSNDLAFCINDAIASKDELEKDGFVVSTLLNEQATRANIKSELKNMLVQNPDVAVVVYSGHGTQVLDTSGDEPDGYDEALYVYDGELIDDNFRDIIDTTKSEVTSLMFIIDACFSGSITRFARLIGSAKARFMPNPKVPSGLPRARRLFEYAMPEVVLTGCGDKQYSYEGNFEGGGHGALTYYRLKCRRNGPLNMTWKQLHEEISRYLPSSQYPQNPQLEGTDDNKNTAVFSSFGTIPDDPPDEPDPPEPTPWYKSFWNSLFGWFWYWKKIDE